MEKQISRLSNADFIEIVRVQIEERAKKINTAYCTIDRHGNFSDELEIIILNQLFNR